MTPKTLKAQMKDLGLACPETMEHNLEKYITEVRNQIQSKTGYGSFLIASEVRTKVSPATFVAPAHELIEPLSDAHRIVKNFVGYIASTKPGTRQYIAQLVQGDSVARDFVDRITATNQVALSDVSPLVDSSDESDFIARIAAMNSSKLDYLAFLAEKDLQPRALGTWVPGDRTITKHQSVKLETIQAPENWEKLQIRDRENFRGHESDMNYDDYLDNAEAIKKQFVRTAKGAAQAVQSEIAEADAEAMISTAVTAMDDGSLKDYDKTDSMLLFLAKGYDPTTHMADGIGILPIEWHIKIGDYKNKDKDALKHHTVMDVAARAIVYTDGETFEADYKYVTKK